MKLRSPAKVNLYLRVVRRRPDGFHELDTVFERISLSDEITLTAAPSGISLSTDRKKVPSGPDNLVWRAAALLQETCGVRKGVRIRLKKRIPVAAGLGGGSSNAATVLLGLNRLWKLKLSRQKLVELGACLGSDVPFFVLETPFAHGTGRGEILKPVSGGRKLWHCLVKPPFGISTQEAYGGLDLASLTPPKADAKMTLHSIRKGDLEGLSRQLTNSLEVSLKHRFTTILEIKNELVREGALSALLSGSGSTVFGLFNSQREATRAARILKKKNKSWQVFVASTY